MTNKEFLAEIENNKFRQVDRAHNYYMYTDDFKYYIACSNENRHFFSFDIWKKYGDSEPISFTFENLEEVRTFFRCLKPF